MTGRNDPLCADAPGRGQQARKQRRWCRKTLHSLARRNPEDLTAGASGRAGDTGTRKSAGRRWGLDVARARYFDLYNLAPVGYCTVSEEGRFQGRISPPALAGGGERHAGQSGRSAGSSSGSTRIATTCTTNISSAPMDRRRANCGWRRRTGKCIWRGWKPPSPRRRMAQPWSRALLISDITGNASGRTRQTR